MRRSTGAAGADQGHQACASRRGPAALSNGQAHGDRILEQCAALAALLTPDAMTRGLPQDPANSIGGHLRHLLDHHEALLRGLESGCIDYDSRDRNTACEHEPDAARRRIAELAAAFRQLEPADETRPLRILCENGTEMETSLGRELDFVASHATHHLAIVALLASVHGIAVPAELGVAASTLRHRRDIEGPSQHTR